MQAVEYDPEEEAYKVMELKRLEDELKKLEDDRRKEEELDAKEEKEE